MNVDVQLPDDFLEQVAQRAAAIVLERQGEASASSPYLGVQEAAEYLRCKPQRVYDLASSGRLTRYRDGARVLVSREEIDAYLAARVAAGVAPSPRRAA